MTSARMPVFFARALAILAAALLVGCGGSSHDHFVRVFTATLSAAQEVPPNASAATGTGIITVDLDTMTLTASLVTAGIVDTTAQLREGAPGLNGPVVLALARAGSGTIWTGGAVISDAQLRALRSGAYYFSAQSAAFPNGEIRGQLAEQMPSTQQWSQLQQARPQSAQLDQHLRLVESAEDWRDWRFSGIGFGFTIGF